MATITTTTVVCDSARHTDEDRPTGISAAATVKVGRRTWKLDLCSACLGTLGSLLPSGTASSAAPSRAAGNARQVRAWAQENGIDLSARGRVPAAVVQAYDAAQAAAQAGAVVDAIGRAAADALLAQ